MKAAHARRIVNPALPFKMEGYNEPRYCLHQNEEQKENICAEGTRTAVAIRDDLLLDCLYLEDSHNRYAFFTIDACIAEEAFVQYCKEYIVKRCNLHEDMISIGTTHTHSGPLLSHGMYFNMEPDQNYWQYLAGQMVSCIDECKKIMHVCTCSRRETKIQGFYNNRNRPGEEYFDKIIEVKLTTEKGIPIVNLLNLAVHPTILGADNYALSNDFFAPLRQLLQGQMGFPIMYLNGEAGDNSPRLVKQGTDYLECVRYGSEISKQILMNTAPYESIQLQDGKVTRINHNIYYCPQENAYLLRKQKELKKQIVGLDQTSELFHRLSTCYLFDVEEKLSHKELRYDSYALIYDFKGIRIVTIPAEIDTVLGKRLRFHDEKETLLWAYTNGFQYYAVNEAEYGTVFESFNTFYPYRDADAFVNDIIDEYERG